MNKKAITWGIRLGSISLAVGLAAYMSAQEAGQQGVSVNGTQQSDTLAPQNGQADSNQQFGRRQEQSGSSSFNEQSDNQYSGSTQSETEDQSGTTNQYGDNGQSGGSMQQNSRSFDTMTGGS